MATEGQTLAQQLEERLDQETFPPPDGFRDQAVVSEDEIYEQADADYEGFWAERAEALDWDTKWGQERGGFGRGAGGRGSGTPRGSGVWLFQPRRSPSGSWAASSTSPTTASTGT